MRTDEIYYRHTGGFNASSVVLVPLLGGVAAAVLGAIYSYATRYIPFIYINFLLTIGLGCGIGFVTAFGLRQGKVRNYGFGPVVGLIIGVIGSYFTWVFWVPAYTDGSC